MADKDCHAQLLRGLWELELRSSYSHSKHVTANHQDRYAMGAQEGAPNGQSWKLLHIAAGRCWKGVALFPGLSWRQLVCSVSLFWIEGQREVPTPVKVTAFL